MNNLTTLGMKKETILTFNIKKALKSKELGRVITTDQFMSMLLNQ